MKLSTLARALRWIVRNRKLILFTIVVILVSILTGCLSHDGSAATLAVGALIGGTAGGKHVVDGPLTTDLTREGSPDLLLNEIDRQIVKIRPMSTPLDQISRYAGSKHVGSMVVDYLSVDTKPTTAQLADDYDESSVQQVGSDSPVAVLKTSNNEIFDKSDTILVQGVYGYEPGGQRMSSSELVLYVLDRDATEGITVMAVNGKKVGEIEGCVPSIESGATLMRMGRAASELDVMSPQFEALPHKSRQYCQIFKMQVEQSTLQRLANKEVDWSMSDQEEAAIYDMRLGMEKSFLFGVKGRLWNPSKKEFIMLTGGIWHQAGKSFKYDGEELSASQVIDLMRNAFTGNAGSKRKILIGGSELIGLLSRLDYTRIITSRERVSRWGIDFSELHSKFGTLYVVMSEIFDECGMSKCGMIIDPEYLQKYSHIPFSTESLNLKASGMRNTDALVMSEASCLVLRYPKAHMRIEVL